VCTPAAGRRHPTSCGTGRLSHSFAGKPGQAPRSRLLPHSYSLGVDLSQSDLDEPLPDLQGGVNGHQSSLKLKLGAPVVG